MRHEDDLDIDDDVLQAVGWRQPAKDDRPGPVRACTQGARTDDHTPFETVR
jgi:hypothetical protein